jgi:hypothetical protein
MLEQWLAQTTPLETQIEVLSSTITDSTTKLHANAYGMERTTATKDEFHW